MNYHIDDRGRTIVDGKLTDDDLLNLAEGNGELEVFVETVDNRCLSAYLDDPDTALRENLDDEAYAETEGEPDVWAEEDGLVGLRICI